MSVGLGAPRARAGALAAACLAVGVSALVALPAAGAVDPATVDEGLWYYTRTGVAEAHATTTGAGVTIAVLDTVINPDAPDLVGANVQVAGTCRDDAGALHPATSTGEDARHGTAVTAVLAGTGAGAGGMVGVRGVAPGATVLHYAITPPGWVGEGGAGAECSYVEGAAVAYEIADAIDQAVAAGADIITISIAGIWIGEPTEALLRAYAAGVIVLAAADNEMPSGASLMDPAGLNGVVAVGRHDIDGALPDFLTPHSPYLTAIAPGIALRAPNVVDGSWVRYALVDGNSYATPWTAGVLALAWSQHPEATANQMIQALVRTTTTASDDATAPDNALPDHDDQYGYGPVSVPRLLAVDPTTLPDENPLLHPLDDDDARPTTEQILAATGKPLPEETPEPTPEPTDEATDEPADPDGDDTDDEATGLPLPLILGGAAALLAAAVVTAVILRRRTTGKDT